jgi:hypothetical protein
MGSRTGAIVSPGRRHGFNIQVATPFPASAGTPFSGHWKII